MTETKLNLIAGTWTAGTGEIENRNPSDLSDLIGMFAQASSDQLEATLDQAKIAQAEWAAYGIER
ncbi:MAG: aldehyde dehydrogenase family protein, partial [Shimia sp.]|nr:aldehyde dehydrogenase family protein [Shimia sp.]